MKIVLLFCFYFLVSCNSNDKNLPVLSYKIDGSGNKSYYTINYKEFTNQLDEDFKVSDKVFIANFFFTRCPSICPPMRLQLIDIAETFKNENDLVTRYREMAMQPELEAAVDEIVNETIVHDVTGKSVSIILDDLEQPEKIKNMIRDEFENVLRMMDFSNYGAEIFRNWYIDGRLFYQVLIDEKQPKLGIQEIVYIDPRKIKKVRTIIKKKDPRTKIEVVTGVEEFYIFNDKASQQGQSIVTSVSDNAVKIAPDAIINVNLRAVFLTSKYSLPLFKNNGGGNMEEHTNDNG